jgi:hypothetical protein
MKQIFTMALLACSSISFAQGSNGLVGHWSFNGNANDVSGNGLNGTNNGAANTAGYNGIANNAMSFNGTSSHVTIPDNALLDVDSFSICALIKPAGFYTNTCQGNGIVWRGHHGDPHLYSLYFSDAPYDGGDCTASDTNKLNFCVEAHGTTVQGHGPFHDPGGYIHTGQWYCVVSTYSDDTIRIYVDGVQVSSSYWTNQFAPGTADLHIGAALLSVSYPYYYKGIIDDVRLYSRALNVGDVNVYCDSAKLVPTAVESINTNQFSLSPNPANDNITLVPQSPDRPYSVVILNSVGQVVLSATQHKGTADIDIVGLPTGLYLIKVTQDGLTRTSKFVKE